MDFTGLFGSITPAMLMGLVYIIVGQVKTHFQLKVWQLWAVALGLSFFFVGLLGVVGLGAAQFGLERLTPEIWIGLAISAVVYSVVGALMSLGLYNVESNMRSGRVHERAGVERGFADDGFPL